MKASVSAAAWACAGGIAYSFEGMAYLAEHENQAARAIQLFAAAHTLRLLIGAPLDADVQEQYAQRHWPTCVTG
jgi:hypothetical protein